MSLSKTITPWVLITGIIAVAIIPITMYLPVVSRTYDVLPFVLLCMMTAGGLRAAYYYYRKSEITEHVAFFGMFSALLGLSALFSIVRAVLDNDNTFMDAFMFIAFIFVSVYLIYTPWCFVRHITQRLAP